MSQIWRSLTFIHWRYDAEIIRRSLPANLTLDTFDGSAWVGLVPFVLAGVRPYGLPVLPWIAKFPETNVRTYVKGPDGVRGVWFYTLEADRLLAVMVARIWYHLPYRWAKMRVRDDGATVDYASERSALFGSGRTDIKVEVGGNVEAGDLENFLTARFRLYTEVRGKVAFAQIEHLPWPLQRARLLRLEEDLVENSGVPRPVGEPLVHFARELKIKAEAPRMARQ